MTNKTAEELVEKFDAITARELLHATEDGDDPRIVLLEQALLAAEQRAQQGWRAMDSCPKIHGKRFLAYDIDVGEYVAEWFEDKFVYSWNQKPCNPTEWMPLPSAPNTPNTVTTSTDAIAYVKTRLAQIASGDYKACGHTAEEVAADALKAIEAEIGGVS